MNPFPPPLNNGTSGMMEEDIIGAIKIKDGLFYDGPRQGWPFQRALPRILLDLVCPILTASSACSSLTLPYLSVR